MYYSRSSNLLHCTQDFIRFFTCKLGFTNLHNSIGDLYAGISDPTKYVRDQVPDSLNSSVSGSQPIERGAVALVYQLENMYLVLAGLAVLICCFTDLKTVKVYLAILAIQDALHVYGPYVAMGSDVFWDMKNWNAMVAGTVWASIVLLVLRVATLCELFGKGPKEQSKEKTT